MSRRNPRYLLFTLESLRPGDGDHPLQHLRVLRGDRGGNRYRPGAGPGDSLHIPVVPGWQQPANDWQTPGEPRDSQPPGEGNLEHRHHPIHPLQCEIQGGCAAAKDLQTQSVFRACHRKQRRPAEILHCRLPSPNPGVRHLRPRSGRNGQTGLQAACLGERQNTFRQIQWEVCPVHPGSVR